MVSKIKNFDYLNASVEDYQSLAKIFYQKASKKYNLNIFLDFENSCYNDFGSLDSLCAFNDNNQIIFNHFVSINIKKLWEEETNYKKRFFAFISCLYHELYHMLIMEYSNHQSCFNLTSLFSAIEYNSNNLAFWQKNYHIIDEEVNAYSYGIKHAYHILLKYYADFDDYLLPKQIIAKHYTMNKFHDYYTYNNEKIFKEKTLIKMINDFKYHPNNPYPKIINKVYNVKENRPKTIDELVSDFTYFYQKYPSKKEDIITFYATLISEKYLQKEQYSNENKYKIAYFLKVRLKREKQKLAILQKIHPQKVTFIKKQWQIINSKQQNLAEIDDEINKLI